MDEVRRCYTLDGLRKTLKSLPRGLETTYMRILAEIPEANIHVALRLLFWIVSAEVPLDLAAAAETVKLDIEEHIFYSEDRRLRNPRILLRICPSLITLTRKDNPSEAEYLTLSHASVKEFLLSGRLQGGPLNNFHVSGTQASLYVAESCVAYLLHIALHDPIAVEGWYWQTFKKYPLLEYVRIFWDTHVRKSQTINTERLNSLAIEYLKSNLVCRISEYFLPGNLYPPDLSPLMRAAELGLLTNLEYLVGSGENVNSVTIDGWTPLSVAVASARPNVVQRLLEHGALANCDAGESMTAFGLAIRMTVGLSECPGRSAYKAVAEILLRNGAKLSIDESMRIWQHALEDSNVDSLRELLAFEVHGIPQTEKSVMLLHSAVSMHLNHYYGMIKQDRPATVMAALVREDLNKIRLLIESGVDIDGLDQNGRTVLLTAVHEAATTIDRPYRDLVIEIVEMLLDFGADIRARDNEGWTPLHWAAAHLNVTALRVLLKREEAIAALNKSGQTALHVAIIFGNDEPVVHILLEYDMPIDTVDNYDVTALGYALRACNERPGIVDLLLQYGASLEDIPFATI